jgi:hypothetical protein
MKKLTFTAYSVLLPMIFFCFTRCNKQQPSIDNARGNINPEGTGLNILLYNKPLDTIRFYIQGKWRLHYQFGGICGTCRHDREQYNEYYEFLPNLTTKYIYQNAVKVDTTYTWTTYKANTQDYIHHIITEPYQFEVEKIVNDTLVLAAPFRYNPDYMLYFLTRSK